ncbi:MAG: hypothetical protein IJV01_01650 [Bacteroidales bacterium]|nr:hypothetical protein [Bacteroidales bacterium]
MVASALVAVGCDKTEGGSEEEQTGGEVTQADFVGNWGWDEKAMFKFKDNGSYEEVGYDGGTISGSWSYKNDKLTLTPRGGDARECGVVLTGGKAWMVLIDEGGEGEQKYRSFESFRKIGATVQSGKLTDGRWDAPHGGGYKPAAYTKDASYGTCMVVKGNKVDLYVIAWGLHVQGTFTITDGKMHIETDNDHIWKAAYYEVEDGYGSIGWNAGSPAAEEFEKDWDDSYASMNAETFELQKGYTWYTIKQLLALGENPAEHKAEYDADPILFKWMVWEWADNERSIAQELCDFDICVAENGQEAYANTVGMSPWFYKR